MAVWSSLVDTNWRAETHNELVALVQTGGEIRTGAEDFPQRAAQMLQSIVATTEYLFA